MENKPSMSRVERLHREKVTRYSIRKYSFGAASVAVAALFMFLGNGAVSVQADQIQPGDTAAAQPATPALDKTQLESYISEIETKLSNGSYDNKTEESVAVLKAELESAKATLANATTQAELKTAYSKLVTTANSKLKNKPVEKKETPAVDTTEGKETVGKKAENTEKNPESNSIENTGSNDARNGKELDKNNAFRAETDTEKPKVSIDYDDPASKTFWVTPTEETNITGRIKITDNSGKIVKGWMQKMGGGTDTNIGYGLNNSNIDSETTATSDQPATLSVTGTLQARLNGNPWKNGSTVVSRKVRAKDASNNEIDNEGSSDPDYQVFFKVRSQNVKYTEDLANKAANFDKVAVADPAQLQQAELDKIKAGLQAGDGNNLNGKIDTVTQKGDKVVITYNDGTTAERPVTDFTRVNEKPTAEFPFSNAAAKEIYVYGAEENSFDIKIKDDSGKISSATLNQGGNKAFAEVPGATNKISTQYGYTANTITAETPATEASPAVVTYSGTPAPEGNFTQDKLDAATRGETPPGVVLGWRFLRVTDADGGEITGRATGADDPGSFVVVLKPQTQKYDVTKPENEAAKVPVVDANHVTDAEFKKIVGANNANIKLHYSKKNVDANLVGKQGQNVDDKDAKIKSVEKVDNNMVVTYKDGSTDTLPLTDFARTNAAPTVEIPYSVDGKKDVYVYANEDFEIPVKFTDDSGKVASATIKRGGNQDSPAKDESNPDVLDNEYNTTVEKISTETVATAENPAIVKIKGNISKDNSGITESKFPKEPAQELTIVTRYATATDTDGAYIDNNATSKSYATDPGSFTIKLKAQTAKYDIKVPETKVPVVDANNVTEAEFNEIKKNIKIQYSTENPDKNLADKKGKEVDNQDDRIESITKDGNNVVVTYKDGSIDKKPLTDFARTNPAPTVELPYSNADKRQIYVYTGENTDLTFKASDDAEVKDLYLRGPGGVGTDNTANYGFTTGKIDNDVVTNGEGTVSDDKRTATIKMTGVTTLTAPNQWTSFVVANDNDNAKSFPADQTYDASTDDAVRQQKPGYVQFIVKSQTDKYDIKAPTEKVAVTDPANVTEAELAKIKEKLQLEHNKNNDDANLADKKGKTVDAEDAKTKIASVTKDDQGNLVVTYTDGSTDKKPLSEFVTLDKQPAINEVNKAAEKQIEAINNNPEATKEEKDKAIEQVNADKAKALEDIANSTATTKPELDKVEKAGTDKIKTDNPVIAKKDEAKKAIDDALAAKNKAIDARPDLTPEEKTKAKEAAKAAADKAKDAVDAAKTNADVDTAAGKIGDELKKVNPVAKEAAKKAIADELAEKEKAIDARTDLTKEEKDAAKKEAQDKAKEATDAINAQPDNAETPEKAAEAQKAVDAAKDKGVADVKAVNPVAAKKAEAKKAIDDELATKNQEIDARTDLTPEEKTKAKEAAKAQADVAKGAVDAATTNAAVDKAKADGTTAVANVTPVAKEAAKKAINDALTAKNKEIDARTDLTDEEKTAAKNEAKDKADAQLAKINEQPDAATTPTAAKTAQDAVDAAKKSGVDEVAAVNPEAKTKPAAKKAIDDKLAEQLKEIANTPDATDDEKKVAADAAKALAEEAKEEIDKAGTDAEVKQLQEEAEGEIEKSVPVVEDKPNARKAIDEEATAKKAAIDARDDLTPKAKEDLKAEVDAIADQAKKSVDAAKTAEAVNGIEESDKAAIKAVGEVNIPADKVLVNDPSALTDDEKAKVLEAVKKVNPDAKEITQDADGNVTVTTPDGHKEIITPEQVVKTADTANDPKAGNDIVKPADKVVVNDPAKLTDAEKEKIKAAVEAVNPNSIVVVDDKGNAKVSTQDGQTQVIPVEELVRTVEDTKKPNAGNDIVKPADKTAVANPEKLTDAEKKAIEDKVKAVNPDATVVVDDKGNATVTTPEGKTAVIPATDLTKDPEAATKPNAGNAVNTPASKVEVKDPANLTDAEKKAIENKVKAVNPGSKVVVDDKGNATVTTPEGKTATIPATDLTKSAADAGKENAGNGANTPATKTVVKDPANLTDEEKAKVKKAVEDVNPGSTVVVNDKGDVIVTKGDGTVLVIPELDLVIPEDKLTDPTQQNGVNIPATRVLVGDKAKLTADEIEKVKESIKAVNPGAIVVVDENGNATVTTPEGKTATIPAAQLVKDAKDVAAKNNGENINIDFEKETVADLNNLTDAEKEAAKAKIKGANADVVEVIFDKAGNATVITKDGKVYTIVAKDIFKQRPYAPSNGGGNNSGNGNGTSGNNAANNTDAKVNKAKLEGAIHQLDELIIKESAKFDAETAKEANALSADAKKVFANADASQAEVDAMVKRIEDFMAKVASSTDHATPANDQAAQKPAVAPATAQAAANASQEATTNARKAAKELPNTGTADSTVAMVAAAASALLGLGLAGRRRKEDEEA